MAWKKSPAALVAAFEKAAPRDPRVKRRPMFGYPALFLNGNMFAGTFEEKVVVRLAEAERSALLAKKKVTPFEPMPGRPMKEYVVVPAAAVRRPAELAGWIEKAFAYALTLPAKASRSA